MKKLTEQQIKDGNKLIAEFMGYIYYEPRVLIDDSDIGGLYESKEVFSKTPIEIDTWEDSDQIYFSQVPNPDFLNKDNPKWNPDYKTLGWECVNFFNYKTREGINYHESFDTIQSVIEKIKEMKYPIMIYQSHIQNTCEIYDLKGEHYIVRESSTILTPIELVWLTVVNFIKIYNKKNA